MNINKKKIIIYLLGKFIIIATLLIPASCTDNNDSPRVDTEWNEYTVAVILPQTIDLRDRWTQTANWALRNIEQAQEGMEHGVRLKIEWYDENNIDMSSLGESLATRAEVVSVIGPSKAEHLNSLCAAIDSKNTRKTVFSTHTGAEEIIHRYAPKGFLWTLNETDATQCEMMLMKALNAGARTVSLLVPQNSYGQTFYNRFAFEATEMGLQPENVWYYDMEGRSKAFDNALNSNSDYILCAMNSNNDIKAFYELKENNGLDDNNYIFSSSAFHSSLHEILSDSAYVEGIGIIPDPSSGFNMAYYSKYNTYSLQGESTLYDAIMLTAFSIIDCNARGVDVTASETINHSLQRQLVSASSNGKRSVWDDVGMEQHIRELASGKGVYHKIEGATGTLDFDTEGMGTLLQSTYCDWYFYSGDFHIGQYLSSKGTYRVSSSSASWNWKKQIEESLGDNVTTISYPDLHEQYAVLVAPSDTWEEYRFQADVLYMYQTLKSKGMDDDHIILIMHDNLADNDNNPLKGTIIETLDGDNLYNNVVVDYDAADIYPSDFVNIMSGNSTQRTPIVFHTDEHDNVLVYWAGHGTQGKLSWLPENRFFHNTGLTRLDFMLMLNSMYNNSRYRKMLWITEACHAESVMSGCNGIPGVMAISAAAAGEVSKAYEYVNGYQTYLSNRFSRALINTIVRDSSVSMRDLYLTVSRDTPDSHVMIDNNTEFDNLYRCSISEFISSK